MDCIFCKLADGTIPTEALYEDDELFVFRDANPQAPFHCLVIPKAHIDSANALEEKHEAMIGRVFTIIRKLAKEHGFADAGYRIVNNCGQDGGQTVEHLHFHVLSGRSLQWPPG